MNDLDRLVEEYFKPSKKEPAFNIQSLLEMVEEALAAPDNSRGEIIDEASRPKRFSETIDIPILPPSEAWGDPGHKAERRLRRSFVQFLVVAIYKRESRVLTATWMLKALSAVARLDA